MFLILQLKRKSPEPTTSGLNEYLTFQDTPRKKKLKQEIAQLRSKVKTDGLKIRRLQMKVMRLKKKVPIYRRTLLRVLVCLYLFTLK